MLFPLILRLLLLLTFINYCFILLWILLLFYFIVYCYLFIYLFIHLFICHLFIYLFICYLFIYSFIYLLFIYLFLFILLLSIVVVLFYGFIVLFYYFIILWSLFIVLSFYFIVIICASFIIIQGSKTGPGVQPGKLLVQGLLVQPGQLGNNKMILFNQILKYSKTKNVKYIQSQYKIYPTVVQSCCFFIRYFVVTKTRRGSAVLRFGFGWASEFFF